jgi:hypothetical protein
MFTCSARLLVPKRKEPVEKLGSGGAEAKIEPYSSLENAGSTLETASREPAGRYEASPIVGPVGFFNRLGRF